MNRTPTDSLAAMSLLEYLSSSSSSSSTAPSYKGGRGAEVHQRGHVSPSEDDSSESRKVPSMPKTLTTMTSSASTSAKNNDTTKKCQQKRPMKKYNNYNIYFMLERQLLLHSRGGDADIGTTRRDPLDVTKLSPDVRRYVDLDLPPLCRRYAGLPLSPQSWFVEILAGRDEKRVHTKSHGLVPFDELATIVARNYKDADQETKGFVNDVAERLAAFRNKLLGAEERENERERESLGKEACTPPLVFPIGTTRNIANGFNATIYSPPNSHVNIIAPPSHDAELERLRWELALAVSSRIESERKVFMLRNELKNYHARKLDQLWQGLQNGQQQNSNQDQRQQQKQQHQQELPRDHGPPQKRHRRSGTEEYQVDAAAATTATAVIGERVDSLASYSPLLSTSSSTITADERSALENSLVASLPATNPFLACGPGWANHRQMILPSAARRGMFWQPPAKKM